MQADARYNGKQMGVKLMKSKFLFSLLLISSLAIAQQRIRPDGSGGFIVEDSGVCAGLFGAAKGFCIGEQQALQQRQMQQQHLLQQQQIENQRLQNELLRQKLEQEAAAKQPQRISPSSYANHPEFLAWRAENPWFETDRAKTEFAKMYAKELRQQRPELKGRPFLDAVTARVNVAFDTSR